MPVTAKKKKKINSADCSFHCDVWEVKSNPKCAPRFIKFAILRDLTVD